MKLGVLLLVCVAGCAFPRAQRVDVGGHRLWMRVAGAGEPTLVFDSGGGDDSSAWDGIEPELRRRLHVRTLVYDRAGMGRSEPMTAPYRVDDEATALRHLLDVAHVDGPVVLVAHSYGGFVATLVAAADPRVAGAVLIDSNLAEFFTDAECARLVPMWLARLDAMDKEQPARARNIRHFVTAFPETVQRLRQVPFPATLPVIDIVSERTSFDRADEVAAWREAHARFAAASPARTALTASGSGHDVMRDRPQLVLDAVQRMVEQVRAARALDARRPQ
ncbi:MAG TPA: alpha/beta hydrolase [Polyangia bacterium]|nr:alpha/beta hydrolase [Polyangia bacterium]